MYYTVIKHSGHLRALEKCRIHSPAARVCYISLEFSNARSVLSQCNTRLRLLYLLNITYHRPGKNHLANQSKALKWLLEISARLKFVFRKHDFRLPVLVHFRKQQRNIFNILITTASANSCLSTSGLCFKGRKFKEEYSTFL